MKSFARTAIIVLILTLIPFITYGQGIEFKNPIKANNIQQLVALILDIVVKIGAVIAVFMFIITGFLFVTAQGNPSKIETAKRSLVGTSIGAVILLGAEVLSQVVQNTVNKF